MTTAHSMLCARAGGTRLATTHAMSRTSVVRRRIALVVVGLLAALASGCEFFQPYDPPYVVFSPYLTDDELLFAVAPLRNESGVSVADELAITDQLAYQLEQVEGVRALPLNRSLEAMRAMGLTSVSTPAEARRLAKAIGAEAIVVGTITAYDPYDPPQLGLSLALYSGTSALDLAGWDPFELQRAPTDQLPPGPREIPDVNSPLSVVSAHLDASNHIVRSRVDRYAWGRTDDDAPMGTDRWIKSMERYTEFCCFVLVEGLMDAEARRLGRHLAAQ